MLGNGTRWATAALAGQAHGRHSCGPPTPNIGSSQSPRPMVPRRLLGRHRLRSHDGRTRRQPDRSRHRLLNAPQDWAHARHRPPDDQGFSSKVDTQSIDNAKPSIDLFAACDVGRRPARRRAADAPGELPPGTGDARRHAAAQAQPTSGHCVVYAAYDAAGPTVVTWGTPVKASWGFHTAYCDELYALLSPVWLRHDRPHRVTTLMPIRARRAALTMTGSCPRRPGGAPAAAHPSHRRNR